MYTKIAEPFQLVMNPRTLSVIRFTVLLLGVASVTNSLPAAVSRQDLVQNNFKTSLPQVAAYLQETAQKSMLKINPASKMMYRQEYPQKSVQNVKPISPLMYAQEAAAAQRNDIMARIAVDECSQVYNWCRHNYSSWATCYGVLAECRLFPAQYANRK